MASVFRAFKYIAGMALSMTISKSLSMLLDSVIDKVKKWWKLEIKREATA